jgi:H+/gluconate symporter-like permease
MEENNEIEQTSNNSITQNIKGFIFFIVLLIILGLIMGLIIQSSKDPNGESQCSMRMLGEQPILDCTNSFEFAPEVIKIG